MQKRSFTAVLGAAIAAFVSTGPVSANLVIAPTFDPSLSPSAVSVIRTAIGFYEAIFVNPITVNINFFNTTSGLGETQTFITTVPYATYYNDLISGAAGANDATALANTSGTTPLAAGTGNPINGGDTITMTVPLARAVGIDAPGDTLSTSTAGGRTPDICDYTGDSCVGLNLSVTDDATGGRPGGYSLLTIVEHEIDEVLGMISSLYGDVTPASPSPEDLFRFSAPGVRSYAANRGFLPTCSGAYFSIDGGTTNLDNFNNCDNGGDYGDWVQHSPTQVQDAFDGNLGSPSLSAGSPEITALDAMGYTQASLSLPEPAGLSLFGLGLGGLWMRRRKRGR